MRLFHFCIKYCNVIVDYMYLSQNLINWHTHVHGLIIFWWWKKIQMSIFSYQDFFYVQFCTAVTFCIVLKKQSYKIWHLSNVYIQQQKLCFSCKQHEHLQIRVSWSGLKQFRMDMNLQYAQHIHHGWIPPQTIFQLQCSSLPCWRRPNSFPNKW